MPLSPGVRLAGTWTIVAVLTDTEVRATGAGGIRARLTLVPRAEAPDAETLRRWEAALAPPRLADPAFPPLLGVGHDAGVVWIARPWSDARSLAAWRGDAGAAGALLARLAAALGSLHGAGASHGRLRAARILVTEGHGCELLDVGLAAIHGEQPDAQDDVLALATVAAALLETTELDDAQRAAAREAIADGQHADPFERASLPRLRDRLAAAVPPSVLPPPPRAPSAPPRRPREPPASSLRRPPAPGPDPDPPHIPPTVEPGDTVSAGAWAPLLAERLGTPAPVAIVADPHGGVTTGPIEWLLGSGQRTSAADAIADAIADAVRALDTGWRAVDLARVLAAAGLVEVHAWPGAPALWTPPEARPRSERWWHRAGVRAVVAGQLSLQRETTGWVTSHAQGPVGHDVARIAPRALRGDPARAAQVIEAMIAVAARVDDRPSVTHHCRFCRGSFAGLGFHASLGACHRCAERHLRIIH